MKGRIAAADVCIGVNQESKVVALGNGWRAGKIIKNGAKFQKTVKANPLVDLVHNFLRGRKDSAKRLFSQRIEPLQLVL